MCDSIATPRLRAAGARAMTSTTVAEAEVARAPAGVDVPARAGAETAAGVAPAVDAAGAVPAEAAEAVVAEDAVGADRHRQNSNSFTGSARALPVFVPGNAPDSSLLTNPTL